MRECGRQHLCALISRWILDGFWPSGTNLKGKNSGFWMNRVHINRKLSRKVTIKQNVSRLPPILGSQRLPLCSDHGYVVNFEARFLSNRWTDPGLPHQFWKPRVSSFTSCMARVNPFRNSDARSDSNVLGKSDFIRKRSRLSPWLVVGTLPQEKVQFVFWKMDSCDLVTFLLSLESP